MVDGTANGMLTAEIINWSGHVLFAPRQALPRVLQRDESSRTGIYFLTGEDPDHPTRTRVYVGEGDVVGERLKAHANDESKDFWTSCCLVTSKDSNLTKAHARFLESRLVQMIKAADRATLANGNEPATKGLPESDEADMHYFVEQLSLILPVIGLEFLKIKPLAAASSIPSARELVGTTQTAPEVDAGVLAPLYLELSYPDKEIKAEGYLLGGEYTVLAGSVGSAEQFASNSYAKRRQELIDDESLTVEGSHVRFTRDVTFKSPSAAAAVLLNRNASGRTEWHVRGSNQTLKGWQANSLRSL